MKQTVHWLRGMTQFFRGKGSGHLAGKERVSSRQSQEGQQSRARMGKNRPDSQEGAPGREENTRASNWLREVVEAISIALILAFLFRAFEAEAFVIPTGSMAPTLMGRHKDLICERCGFSFQTGASEEVDKLTNRPTGRFVLSATCPNCRYTMYVGPNKDDGPPTPSYKGDRILVSKYEYHLSEP
ncbi:MAG TPA: S26 family signal peptidase, partial [Thermogutta sp.]|nr:S26 family signal peptidase [Thermogutta sp.]